MCPMDGNIQYIEWDNGTNFTGGMEVGRKSKLQKTFAEMSNIKIRFFPANLGAHWVTIS